MTHPSFEFLLDAHRYLVQAGLVGKWRPVQKSFHEWGLKKV